jgi:N-acetylglucosamine-6-sulfatase
MDNLYPQRKQKLLGVTINQLRSRLDALLLVLKSCEGETCYKPWTALHPAGDVKNLRDALDGKFDNFYVEKQNKVHFDECLREYRTDMEQPLDYFSFGEGSKRDFIGSEEYENWLLVTD